MMPAIAKTVIQEPVLMKGSNLFKIPKILADHYLCKKKKKEAMTLNTKITRAKKH